MNLAGCPIIALLLTLALTSPGWAQAVARSWNLTTADFRTQPVTLQSLDERGVSVLVPGQTEPRTIAIDELLELERVGYDAAVGAVQAGAFVAVLTDGDRLAGAPLSTAGETITWKSSALGESKISMRNLRAIVRNDRADNATAPDEPRVDDLVILSNGDTLRGVIVTVAADGVAVQPTGGGDESRVPLDQLSAIHFAATPGANPRADTAVKSRFRITLTDGTSFSLASPRIANDKLKLGDGRGGGAADVSLHSIALIEHVNGPVAWLSSMRPTENIHTPYFDLAWPNRFGRSVTGDPIRAGDRTVIHGIGVHSYSRLTFPIDPGRKAFRTQFAIAGDLPFADATVRIKLDGKVAHETQSLRAGNDSPIITLETGDAKTITLEVDYGAGGDVQDRVNWIEPALLRDVPAAPATLPATVPATSPAK